MNMADIATPSAVAMSTSDAASTLPEKQQKTRTEKPDEPKYKEDLAKAEKEHAAAQGKLVRRSWITARQIPQSP